MNRKLISILALLLGLYQALAEEELSIPEETDKGDDISTRILTANERISEFLMEGDVAMPMGRNAMKCSRCKWKKSSSGFVKVPYEIADDFSAQQKKVIENAMVPFHKKTCIRFVPRVAQKDFISIESHSGCWSYLGKTGGKQTVSLYKRGCVHKGVTQHELLHALGFHHEQSRSDRDSYVRINWQYIRSGNTANFRKSNTNNLKIPYDYSSIMHYGRYAFTKTSGKETITPIPNSRVRIGQRGDLSETDILKVNRLYKCFDPSTNTASTNATLQELMRRLDVTETQLKGLMSRSKALEKQLENIDLRPEAKVAFSATLQTDKQSEIIGPFEEHFILKYDNVIINVRNAYNPHTGIFTAPVKGVYFFTFAVFNRLKNDSGVRLMRNGEMVVSATENKPEEDKQDTTSNSVSLLLEQSDRVYIELGATRTVYTDKKKRNTFNGHLLYPM